MKHANLQRALQIIIVKHYVQVYQYLIVTPLIIFNDSYVVCCAGTDIP